MNNSKVSASMFKLLDRAEARAERQSHPTLFGQAGIKKAVEARRALTAGAKGSNDQGAAAAFGRDKLLAKAFAGTVSVNAFYAPKTIEEAARAAGWVTAARAASSMVLGA